MEIFGRYARILSFCGLLALCSAATAQAPTLAPELQVSAVDPAVESTLAAGDIVSLQLRYASPRRVHFRVTPYGHGAPVPFGKHSPTLAYPALRQAAFAWLTVDQPTDVDTLHVAMTDANTEELLASADVPVQLHFTGAAGVTRQRAVWTKGAQQYFDSLVDAQNQLGHPSAGGTGLFVGFMLLVLGLVGLAVGLPIYGLVRWRGGWRIAAALPLLPIVMDFVRIATDLAKDPSSHNLAPFEIGIWSIASLVLMLMLLVARAATRGRKFLRP